MSELDSLTSQWRNPYDQPIDLVLVNRKASPGRAVVEGASDPRKWDERTGFALGGSTLFYTGFQQAHFSVKVYLYTPAQWAEWYEWVKPLQKKPKRVLTPDGVAPVARGDFGAFDIWHPFLEKLGIKSAVVEEIMQPVLTDESGEWMHEIKMISFRNPKPAIAKPKAPDAPPVPDANEVIITSLVDQNLDQMAELAQ
jgi:hypothetical protein